jgi:hypothetical protein
MSGLYLVALKAMHAALSSSLRPILTFRQIQTPSIVWQTPIEEILSVVKNCVSESRKFGSSINNRVNMSLTLKFSHLYEVMCYCLLQAFVGRYLLFTHKTTKTESEQKDLVLIVQLSLKKHFNCLCTGKGMLIWFSFGHLGQWFIAGIVKRFVQCHVFVQSLPGQCPTDKCPVNTFYCSQFV